MKDLGEIKQVLGCEVLRDLAGAYLLTQRQYILAVIKKYFATGLKPCRTPMSESEVFTSDMGLTTPEDK